MTRAVSNPVGRLDVLLLRLAEQFTRVYVEPAIRQNPIAREVMAGVDVWGDALKPIIEPRVKRLPKRNVFQRRVR